MRHWGGIFCIAATEDAAFILVRRREGHDRAGELGGFSETL